MGKLWELYLYVVCCLPMSVLPSKHPQLLKFKYKYKEKRVPIMISATTVIENFWEPTSPLTTTAPAKATGWGIAGIASHLKDFIQNSETSSPPKDLPVVTVITIKYELCFQRYSKVNCLMTLCHLVPSPRRRPTRAQQAPDTLMVFWLFRETVKKVQNLRLLPLGVRPSLMWHFLCQTFPNFILPTTSFEMKFCLVLDTRKLE